MMKYLFVFFCLASFIVLHSCKKNSSEIEAFKQTDDYRRLCENYAKSSKSEVIQTFMEQQKLYFSKSSKDEVLDYLDLQKKYRANSVEIKKRAEAEKWPREQREDALLAALNQAGLPEFVQTYEQAFIFSERDHEQLSGDITRILKENMHLFKRQSELESLLAECAGF